MFFTATCDKSILSSEKTKVVKEYLDFEVLILSDNNVFPWFVGACISADQKKVVVTFGIGEAFVTINGG